MKQTITIGILLALLLSGCSTPYERVEPNDEKRYRNLEGDKYEVTYFGDNSMDRDKIQDYCLLSCAEVTNTLGFKNFAIVERNEVTKYKDIEYFDPYKANQYLPVTDKRDRPPRYHHKVPYKFQYKVEGYQYVIYCFSSTSSSEQFWDYYVAKEVLDELSEKYGIKMGEPVAGTDSAR